MRDVAELWGMKALIVGAMLAVQFPAAGVSQPPPSPNPGPVQAEFLTRVDVRHLVPGGTVFARVTLDWNGPGCSLRTGAILESTVETADRRQGFSDSRLALSFTRAQCNGAESEPMKLMLAAVAGPPQDWRIAPNPEFRIPMSSLLANGKTGAGFGGLAINNFSAPTLELTGILHRFPMSPKVQPGDVIGIRGMKLDLGTGPNETSVLTTKHRDLVLDASTQILLVPESMILRSASSPVLASGPPADVSSPAHTASRAPAPPAGNDLETCAPPGCAVDLPVTAKELTDHGDRSIPIEPLGYTRRPEKIRGDFDDEVALAWLGGKELVLAFNRHPLIHRTRSRDGGAAHRVVRAVLLDAQSRSIELAVDWEITDTRRYLWPLDRDRILVHVGNELRVYRAGLELERAIPLSGPLAFVRISPNGELVAFATIRERHSAELHARLREDLGEDPEEDVNVAILDKGFSTIAQASTISSLQAPTLLNEGQVRVYSQPNMRFRLALNTWDNKTVTLARFASRCVPELASVAPDLLFLLSCDVATGATTYRVMSAGGKLLLRGEGGPRDVGQEAMGNRDHAKFAIKVVHATRELSPGIEFKETELESEEVRVYRASDGKRLLAVRVNEPVASHDSYALSPDGDQLAVLSESQIRFFSIPPE